MEKMEFTALEREMMTMNMDTMQADVEIARTKAVQASSGADVRGAICEFWSKYGKFIKIATKVPVVGKYVQALADLLDALCA